MEYMDKKENGDRVTYTHGLFCPAVGADTLKGEEQKMKQLICPVDGKPCEADCPDRYIDRPDGGCLLTTAQELGLQVINLGNGDTAIVYVPAR